jgi:DNA-binding NarL/FixJ family response regulator
LALFADEYLGIVGRQMPDDPGEAMADRPITILLATDFPILRDALCSIVAGADDLTLTSCVESEAEIVLRAREERPNLVILDTSFVSDSVLNVIEQLIEQDSKVLLIGADMDNTQVIEALFRGASGIVGRKSTPELICRSIRAVVAGELWVSRQLTSKLIDLLRTDSRQTRDISQAVTRIFNRAPKESGGKRVSASVTATPGENRFGLTRRELQIIGALVEGQTNKDIAATFGVSEYTVKHHLTNVFDKLGVYNRLELVLFAINHQLCAIGEEVPAAMSPADSSAANGNGLRKR